MAVVSLKKGVEFVPTGDDRKGITDDICSSVVHLKCYFCNVAVNESGIVIEDPSCEIKKGKMIMDWMYCKKRNGSDCTLHAFVPPNWGMNLLNS